jgi:hypothetical protein
MIIKKMYEIHNWFYESKELIPEFSFDGKDVVKEKYVLLHDEDKDLKDINAYDVPYFGDTLAEVEQELKYSL